MHSFPSIQQDFKSEPWYVTKTRLRYPQKKLRKGFNIFGQQKNGISYAL